MHKSIVFLAALTYVQVSLAAVSIWIENNDNSKNKALWVPDGQRYCYCLSNTQTAYIDGRGAGVVKLFGKADCTGNFADGSGTVTSNAQWVNSVSFGASGVPSTWGGGKQCNQYA
ncbi:hypothetical protein BGZ97_012257 [Linnemannia gamsii]|jgi:hypothetical protein|uniref:Uncharacterized protein n=1 Tax=Linnemannia gamsii TaxID=64522 RepID=A0A9P6R475_9FUNG|nr:hypothetical protein BGZ97_012257 [Linnemannia gamsii]